jgi:hypothetical protein
MIVHQTIGPDLQGIPLGMNRQKLQVGLAVFVIEKYHSTVIASLGNVVGITRGYYTSNSWHNWMLQW